MSSTQTHSVVSTTELFVKFSRDFDDPVRDRGRTQMESEVKFASLSLAPGFPIVVPRTLFADYHRATGTGILISQRIAFGVNGIEPQHHKCLDYEMPRPADHYRALLTSIARLAGAHRSGRLPTDLTDEFPVDLRAAAVGEPPPLTPERLHRRIARLAEFADAYPGLLPDNVRSRGFLDRLAIEAPQVLQNEAAVWRCLAEATDYIALSPLERQRRQRVVLDRRRRGVVLRSDGLGLRQSVERRNGDLGSDVGRRNRFVGRPFR